MKPKHHVFVCTNRRPAEAKMPSCAPNGAGEVLEAFQRERAARGLYRSVYITQSLCLGVCPEQGSTVVVYPEGVWYVGVTASDAAEIFSSHIVGGRPVERLIDRRNL
jgi:(2Fe-2S) ferredoxin